MKQQTKFMGVGVGLLVMGALANVAFWGAVIYACVWVYSHVLAPSFHLPPLTVQ